VYSNDWLKSSTIFQAKGKVLKKATYEKWALDGIVYCFYPNGSFCQTGRSAGNYHGHTFYFNQKGEVDFFAEFYQDKTAKKVINHDAFRALEQL